MPPPHFPQSATHVVGSAVKVGAEETVGTAVGANSMVGFGDTLGSGVGGPARTFRSAARLASAEEESVHVRQ